MDNMPRKVNHKTQVLRVIWIHRKGLIILLTPMLLLPIPLLGKSQVANCIYMISVMATYWTTEACPFAVTSLLPAVMCPLFGMQEPNVVAMNYMKHTSFLVIGTITVCIAIEECGLHRRVALKVLLFFGSEPHWILLGLMTITGFLSMWLMNLSTVSLMLPLTVAVCRELQSLNDVEKNEDMVDEEAENKVTTSFIPDESIIPSPKNLQESSGRGDHFKNTEKAMLLGITYGSTIGGICTVVGTPTNLIGIGIYREMFDGDKLNFVTWISFCLPLSVLGLLIAWIWMQIRFLNIRHLIKSKSKESAKRVKEMLQKTYNELPKLSFAEKAVGIHFLVLVTLWIFRDPQIFPGWGNLFLDGYVKDSTSALLIGISILLFPSKSSSLFWILKSTSTDNNDPVPSLLEWGTFQKKFPWDTLLLLGAGFAIAGACEDSGFSSAVGNLLAGLEDSSQWVVVLAISMLTSIATEFTSNTASVSILLPILLPMASSSGIHPLTMMLTVTLSCSFAFGLPVATPCNALVFSTGALTIPDMLSAGIPLNLIFVALLNLLINLAASPIFNLESPTEVSLDNVTSVIPTVSAF